MAIGPDGTRRAAPAVAGRRPEGMETVVRGDKILWIAGLVENRTFAGMPVAEVNRMAAPNGDVELTFIGAAPQPTCLR